MILVIARAEDIGDDLAEALSARGHRVTSHRCGLSGLLAALNEAPDLVLLGVGLPDLAVTHLLTMLRAVSDVPVIVVVARGAEQLTVRFLELGADTVLVTPLGADELVARVQAVLRRGRGEPPPSAGSDVLAVGGLVLDQCARTAQLDGVSLDLARREFDLLWALARRNGAVATRRELLAEVWHRVGADGAHTLSVYLSRIREKLGETAATPRLLHIVRGVGLRLADLPRGIAPGAQQEISPHEPSHAAYGCPVEDGPLPGRSRVARCSSGARSGAA